MKASLEKIRSSPTPNILVIGDLILDEYVCGNSHRIAYEAPVPIVEYQNSIYVLGGAANVANNLRSLGAKVFLAGVIGNDVEGIEILLKLEEYDIDATAIVKDGPRCTTLKTRVMANRRLVSRIDREVNYPIEYSIVKSILSSIDKLPSLDAIIISDYGLGVIRPELSQDIIASAASRGIPTIVDPKGIYWKEKYWGATALTPNTKELAKALQIDKKKPFESTGCRYYIETAGADGIYFFERDIPAVHFSATHPHEVNDVTGAGDTLIAAFTLGLACGGDPKDCAELANLAAGIKVGKIGTATVSLLEIRKCVNKYDKRLFMEELPLFRETAREQGKTIVFAGGCFDLLHGAHIALLHKAREKGDVLIVGLNSNESIRRLKGEGRPIMDQVERAAILSSLDCVDGIIVFDENIPFETIRLLKPDIIVKGSDWGGREIPERVIVESYGGRFEIIDSGSSRTTTKILRRIRDVA